MNWIALERALWAIVIEPAVIIFGILFVLAVVFGVLFCVMYPIVCLIEWIYGLIKRRWYRQYFSLKKKSEWKKRFLYNRLFREKWFTWIN